FLQKQPSVRAAILAIKQRGEFLPTIFPYRGESWGTWSQVTYLNQRHFASAIGILLLVLIFLVIRYRMRPKKRPKPAPALEPVAVQPNRSSEIVTDTPSDKVALSESPSEPEPTVPAVVSLATEPTGAVQPNPSSEIVADRLSDEVAVPENRSEPEPAVPAM